MRRAALAGMVAVAGSLLLGAGVWCGWGSPTPCVTEAIGERLGTDHLLLGGRLEGGVAQEVAFDLRYHYVTGGLPEEPCEDCRTCSVGGVSCANPSSCGWWGCWQRDDEPPGLFVRNFVQWSEQGGTVPMLTWYQWLQASGGREGNEEIAALQEADKVRAYLLDYRFLVATADQSATGPWLLHLEPDLWAFARKVAEDPRTVPVALPDDLCEGLPANVAGLSACMLRIARTDGPKALVGLHASSWDRREDAFRNTRPVFDVTRHAQGTADYLRTLGAEQADFIVVEMNHRDAGYNGEWWDPDDQSLPNFAQARRWAREVSLALGVPHLWWQIPLGNPGLSDTCGAYRDNRVDYVFDHPERFADGTTIGFAFGAGAECMTDATSDGGHFVERATVWFSRPRPRLCASGG